MKEQWDARYRSESYVYGQEPNEWLKTNLSGMKPGAILFAAEGEGRNAVYAAEAGWTVSAFDQSAVGRSKALQLAHDRNVTLNYEVGDALDIAYPTGTFDALALIYAHFPAYRRKTIIRKLLKSLKDGGIVIFEAFSKQQLSYQEKYHSGGPKEIGMLYSIAEVGEEFEGIEFTELREEEIELSEGDFHRGPASVIRFAGRKVL